jgi:hypothetical protein
MAKTAWIKGVLAVGLLLSVAGVARADRIATARTTGFRNNGVRRDVTVPYLTSGFSTFMTNSVAPRIFSSPVLDFPREPGIRPVFNLPFWGAVQAFGDRSNGALSRR